MKSAQPPVELAEVPSPTPHPRDLYNIEGWANDYFSVGPDGHLLVHPDGPGTDSIDLKARVDEVRERGIAPPLLFRFSELVGRRVVELNHAFRDAIAEYGYRGSYRGVYPIKVNQDRFLVQQLVEAGRPFHFGLEAGSKPELLAVMAMLDDPEALVVCNGYKDEEYVEMALLASRLGRRVILVVEKLSELRLIARVAERTGIAPLVGLRARLSERGAGHWEESGGDRAKFGLSSSDLVDAVSWLRDNDLLDQLVLVHFHLGSQISAIRSLKGAIREAAWTYANLIQMGAPLEYLDVGGGLGVDYQGTRSDVTSSMNYSLQEYVNDVVHGVQQVCDTADVAHPTLVTESGRATVAHHAVLVVDVLGIVEFSRGREPEPPPSDASPPMVDLYEAWRTMDEDNFLEAWHDSTVARDDCRNLFKLGHLSLENRARADELHWAVCRKAWAFAQGLGDGVPDEMRRLARELADIYFCNFSVFQSVPDSWAIDQLFPILPIHRLDEEPTQRAVLADISCDSDGKIDHFIDRHGEKRVLELHPFDPESHEPYYLGIFLVGAYQEILGDLHNLFGDTNTVNIRLDEDGEYEIVDVIEGDTVTDVLRYVSYSRRDLLARVRRSSERALRRGILTREESRELLQAYETGLAGYTYLESD